MKKRLHMFLVAKDYQAMTSGWHGVPYFRGYGRDLVSEPAISINLGGLHRRTTQALRHLPLIMASGPAGPLAHPFGVLTLRRKPHGCDHLRPSLWSLLLPLCSSKRHPFRLTATALRLWKPPLSDFRPSLVPPPSQRQTLMLLSLFSSCSLAISLCVIHTRTGSRATMRCIILGKPLALPANICIVFPHTPAPLLLGDSGACWQRLPPHHQRRHRPLRPLTNPVYPCGSRRPIGREACFLTTSCSCTL